MTLYTAVAGFGRDPFSSDDGLMMDCHPTITYHQCAAAGQRERENEAKSTSLVRRSEQKKTKVIYSLRPGHFILLVGPFIFGSLQLFDDQTIFLWKKKKSTHPLPYLTCIIFLFKTKWTFRTRKNRPCHRESRLVLITTVGSPQDEREQSTTSNEVLNSNNTLWTS